MTKFFLFLLLTTSSAAIAQQKPYQGFPSLIWPKLYSVTYKPGTDGSPDFEKPIFTADLKKLQGKKVSLPGYIVPFDGGMTSNHFILSSLPLNACFFCGVGGPETVIEIFAKSPVRYTEKPVEVDGVLRLNDTDPEKMIFILEQAEVVGEIDE